MDRKLILPVSEEGLPNLEIRRMQKTLEAEREQSKVHPQTADEISRHLDELQSLTQNGKVRGLLLTAILTKNAEHGARTLFSAPREDVGLCREVLQYSITWIDQIASHLDLPPPPKGA